MKHFIAIRHEDKGPWEKRTPLIPADVRDIIQNHPLEIWVQPSSVRIFPDEDYLRVGAKIGKDLTPCPMILAIKEIPLHFFEREKIYLFFSHTIKGQSHNMAMLKKMVDLRCTLIEYEKIENEKGQRLLFFGKQAGQAGMIDTLWALGQRLAWEGKKTPFSSIKQAYLYQSLAEAEKEIDEVGKKIQQYGLDLSLVPLVCGFTGYGHVSQGAQEIFDVFPGEEIAPEEIQSLFEKKRNSHMKVYKVVFKEEHMVEPISSDQKFDLKDYYKNPQKYRSIFESYLPFLTVLVNCIYWAPEYPRFVTKRYLKQLYEMNDDPTLRVIGDITCDIEGSIECTVKATSIENPVFVYDPIKDEINDGVEGKGPVIMSIDNLPAEIPLESSISFSKALKPMVPILARANFSGDFEQCQLPMALKRAVILYKGEFTPDFEYMKDFIKNL
ncbi:bifunctional lysine ketoglutarate reductase /saccharopine dehydrogenase family protein [Acidobacteriota bacterium]